MHYGLLLVRVFLNVALWWFTTWGRSLACCWFFSAWLLVSIVWLHWWLLDYKIFLKILLDRRMLNIILSFVVFMITGSTCAWSSWLYFWPLLSLFNFLVYRWLLHILHLFSILRLLLLINRLLNILNFLIRILRLINILNLLLLPIILIFLLVIKSLVFLLSWNQVLVHNIFWLFHWFLVMTDRTTVVTWVDVSFVSVFWSVLVVILVWFLG